MKKILAIILALVSLVGITAMGVSAQAEAQEKEPLKFGDDGKFKILQMAQIWCICRFFSDSNVC